jgi:membrane protease YdiL (CAAX protease family)
MYIEQFKNSKFNFLLYLPFPIFFFGMMILNFIAIKLLKLDVNTIMKDEIATKGVNRFFVETLIPFVIGIILLFLWVRFVQKQSITSLTTSRKSVDWKRIFFSFALWGAITILLTAVSYYLSPNDFVWNFNPNKFYTFLLLAICLVPLQTSFEEYLFRAHIMQGVGVLTNSRLIPLLFTSITFGLMHLANPEVEKMGYIVMVYYIGTGLFLGILALMDDGLELSLGFHAANNLITALLVTSDWTAFQTDSVLKDISQPEASFDIVLPVLVIYPILLFIFSKKYNWTNWKEKLTGKLIEIPQDK